jgi:predicted N-acyltransferase
MPDSGEAITVKLSERIDEIGETAWDSCAGRDNPFLTYAFLHALEASNSASAETGWLPQHLVAEDSCGRVVGVVPMYLKSHSYGEYVFDHGWADAYRRAGGRYYPKLQVSVPFTPVSGPRRGPRCADRGAGQGRRAPTRLVIARHLLHRRGGRGICRSGLPDPLGIPVSLGESRLSQL